MGPQDVNVDSMDPTDISQPQQSVPYSTMIYCIVRSRFSISSGLESGRMLRNREVEAHERGRRGQTLVDNAANSKPGDTQRLMQEQRR